jgi:hypothetical protein
MYNAAHEVLKPKVGNCSYLSGVGSYCILLLTNGFQQCIYFVKWCAHIYYIKSYKIKKKLKQGHFWDIIPPMNEF